MQKKETNGRRGKVRKAETETGRQMDRDTERESETKG